MTAPDIQARLVEGGSRELDEAVLDSLGLSSWRSMGHGNVWWPVSQSVDAALALAELVYGNGPLDIYRVGPTEWGVNLHEVDTAYAATPAAALCIAILKAKALQDGHEKPVMGIPISEQNQSVALQDGRDG